VSVPQAVAFARHEHANEITQWGTPMIDHVLDVAEEVKLDELTQIVAILSRVELTLDTEQHILKRFGPRVTKALMRMHPRGQWSYGAMVWECKEDNHARMVLLADARVTEAHYGDMAEKVRHEYMIQFAQLRHVLTWEPENAQ
jgi:(p)ppGpp synthase/HD superfamily hydrolase